MSLPRPSRRRRPAREAVTTPPSKPEPSEVFKFLRERDVRIAAIAYFRAKGRLPQTPDEFVEWLCEFDAHIDRMMESLHKAFEDHMNTCTRPILVTR